MSGPDVVSFIRARLDEREQAARAATPGPWVIRDLSDATFNSADGKGWWWVWRESVPHYAGVMEVDHNDPEAPVGVAAITDYDHGATERADAEHIALNDPVHVLSWVAALRTIVDVYEPLARIEERGREPYEYAVGLADALGDAVRQLAAVWRTHPDYNPAWTPQTGDDDQ